MPRRLEPNQILLGDSRELLKTFPDGCVDAVVTDPPAGISFMGRTWDDPGTLGVSGGMAMPATTSSRNPSCRNCGGRKRAGAATKSCQCETPDWNDLEYRLKDRGDFIDFLHAVMRECYRVLKPGGHAVVWALPRTSHWTATAIENAGFEIRDCIYHCFGVGFPKSLNIGKAIDKMGKATAEVVTQFQAALMAAREARGLTCGQVSEMVVGSPSGAVWNWETGLRIPTGDHWNRLVEVLGLPPEMSSLRDAAEREVLYPRRGVTKTFNVGAEEVVGERPPVTAPATPDAKKWEGWGTALKPAVECWWLCRKPIDAQNVAANVLKHGTGAINIDGCRVAGTPQVPASVRASRRFDDRGDKPELAAPPAPNAGGRWPANLMLSHSEGCRQIGEARVPAPVINRFTDGMKPFGDGAGHPFESTGGGTEIIPVYECVPGCPVRAMDEQSGVTGGGNPTLNSDVGRTAISTTAHNPRDPNQTESLSNYGDAGGASRYFQTFDSKGRWPANMVLSHAPGCVRCGTKQVKGGNDPRRRDGTVNHGGEVYGGNISGGSVHASDHAGFSDADGMETVEDWECAEGCPVREIDRQGQESGVHPAGSPQPAQDKYEMSEQTPSYGGGFSGPSGMRYGDDGGASRFFQTLEPEVPFYYTAKASRSEKEDGLEDRFTEAKRRNTHPTIKPVSLMRYLVRMVTPKGGIVLDPFAGSGTTLIAAVEEGMQFLGIEREEEYLKIAERRVGVVAKREAQYQAERDIFEMMMNLGDDE